jgi:sulfite reductase beta subunit-like hemoprotein
MSSLQTEEKKVALPPVVEEELRRFEENIRLLRAGQMDPNEFKKFRLNNGTYGIRHETDRHMIRIKVPHGDMTADQLDAVAEVTEKYTRLKMAHVTTRQAIQIHHVHLDDVVSTLRILAGTGLTSREACGNTVRNITATPYAGFLPGEAFDVTPYANALFHALLRNPALQNFPRKFKIAFYGGGPEDLAYTMINDIGAVAQKRVVNGKEEKGFKFYLGGGLGATPAVAVLLEEFTPIADFFPTVFAVARIFDRFGDRKDKMHARLKFVVRKFGAEEFVRIIKEERGVVRSTQAGGWSWQLPVERELTAPRLTQSIDAAIKAPAGFEEWRRTNVLKQKHAGYSAVTVVCRLGDITVKQMRDLAIIARKYNGGSVRTTVQQNLFLPWIKDEHLVPLFAELAETGLSSGSALRLADVTRCPGADTCQIAITKSRGLASAIDDMFNKTMAQDRDLTGLNIKISGCTNSCGQHHIGNIGFFGTYRKIDGREVPHYQLLVGGDAKAGEARFGQPIMAIPAKRGPDVVKKLVELYKAEKQGEESFVQTMDRIGKARIKAEIEPFRTLPPYDGNKELYQEWGEFGDFKSEIGQGECAA